MNWLKEKAADTQLWKDFLEQYRQVIHELVEIKPDRVTHVEFALQNLLVRYHTELPPLQSEQLHPDFRKLDVCDPQAPQGAEACIDLAFWHLLFCCKFFWKTRETFLKERDLREGS